VSINNYELVLTLLLREGAFLDLVSEHKLEYS